MTGETRALGAVVMTITAVLAVAFALLLISEYLVPVIQSIEAIGR